MRDLSVLQEGGRGVLPTKTEEPPMWSTFCTAYAQHHRIPSLVGLYPTVPALSRGPEGGYVWWGSIAGPREGERGRLGLGGGGGLMGESHQAGCVIHIVLHGRTLFCCPFALKMSLSGVAVIHKEDNNCLYTAL